MFACCIDVCCQSVLRIFLGIETTHQNAADAECSSLIELLGPSHLTTCDVAAYAEEEEAADEYENSSAYLLILSFSRLFIIKYDCVNTTRVERSSRHLSKFICMFSGCIYTRTQASFHRLSCRPWNGKHCFVKVSINGVATLIYGPVELQPS
jgi:hypothetical protein